MSETHVLWTLRSGLLVGRRELVFFRRYELGVIMQVYGRMVAAGLWRDYALDTYHDRAVFSIYRRTSQAPTYRVEKIPALARKQGAYMVLDRNGRVLKRGQELKRVLQVLERNRIRLL